MRTLILLVVLINSARAEEFSHAVVAADHRAASEAGVEILKKGGNAVDAAVATSFALSVVRPASCGIGGGGFMVIWDAENQTSIALDYREAAPEAADADFFTSQKTVDGQEELSVRGGRAVGVPGTVAGLCYANKHYGRLPLADVLQPAIRLAKRGVLIDQHDQSNQKSVLAKFRKYDGYGKRFSRLKQQYLNNGEPWAEGDRFYSPQLLTLEKIAAEGPSGFYSGEVAQAIVDACNADQGEMTLQDIGRPKVVEREPLQADFKGHRLLTMPPPSSGGVALIQTVKTLQAWEKLNDRPLQSVGRTTPEYLHVLTEAMKHAFADRAQYLGDTDYADVPLQRMMSSQYAQQIAQRIQNKAQVSENYGRFFAADDSGTSHFSVIDQHGNAVACTETINLTYGSFVVVPKWGILLNDEMDDFAANPGKPNAFGLIQSEANAVQPRKKPLSSMTPTLAIKNGKAVFASGASGGPRIISATIQALLNRLIFGLSAQECSAMARIHHQWFPNELLMEPDLYDSLADSMRQRGHKVRKNASLAANQTAVSENSRLSGGSDPRKNGQPAGY